MGRSVTCIMLAVIVYGSNVTAKKSDIEEFWTDDYKVFQQVYGKTSDKDLYGAHLPTSITDNGDKKKEASETRERYVINYNDPDSIEFDQDYDDNYNNNKYNKRKKPAKSPISLVKHSKYKPISQASDPQVYSYLKHLEDYSKEERKHHKSNGFKPYFNHDETSSEENDTYGNIQDIIEAHERNKRKSSKNKNDNKNYLKYLKNKKIRPSRNEVSKHRCSSRCRKSGHGYRSRRPHRRTPTLKKIVVV